MGRQRGTQDMSWEQQAEGVERWGGGRLEKTGSVKQGFLANMKYKYEYCSCDCDRYGGARRDRSFHHSFLSPDIPDNLCCKADIYTWLRGV